MKRRSFEPSAEAPLRIPISSRQEMSRRKRVKLVDVDVDNNPLNFKFNASSMPVEVKKATRADDAKTSEYAFFKKLKDDADQKFASHTAHHESNKSDEFGLRNPYIGRESNSVVNNSYKDVTSSLLVENATTVNFISCNSPLGGAAEVRKSDVHTKKVCETLDVQRKQKYREEDGHSLRLEGNQHRHAEVFTRKRRKLRRWVTDVSFPEIDGLRAKRYDVVSLLLSRLIPESKVYNNSKDQKFGQVDTDDRSLLGAYPESDIHCKKLRWIPTKDSTDLEVGPYIDNAIPHSRTSRTRERILYLDAPCNHDNNTHHWNRLGLSDTELLGGNWALCTDRDLSFSFPFGGFGFIEPVKELAHLTSPNRCLVGNQSETPLLEWDFDNKKLERDFSSTFQDMETNAHPASLLPWVEKDKLNIGELFWSSSIHHDEEYGSLLPLSFISSQHNNEYGVGVLQDKEEIPLGSNHIPLTSPWRGNHFGTCKDRYNDTGFYHQDNWLMRKFVSQGHHHSQTEDLLSSRLVLDLGWKCFSFSGFPQECYSYPYHALEYPGNQGLESCLDDSNHKEKPAHFSQESDCNVCGRPHVSRYLGTEIMHFF